MQTLTIYCKGFYEPSEGTGMKGIISGAIYLPLRSQSLKNFIYIYIFFIRFNSMELHAELI